MDRCGDIDVVVPENECEDLQPTIVWRIHTQADNEARTINGYVWKTKATGRI